jgi:preprotein translocase subunit SecE
VVESSTDESADDKPSGKGETPKKGRATAKRDKRAEASLGTRIKGFFSFLWRFLREVVSELRKVIWPTRKQLVTYTIVVVVFVSFMVALTFGLDLLFAKGAFWLFA